MPFAISEACVDVMDRACVTVCPVDCIYEGGRKLYINPIECIDCGACEPACPADAIRIDEDLAPEDPTLAENEAFFTSILPGRDAPLERAGGARKVGVVGVDIPRIAALDAS